MSDMKWRNVVKNIVNDNRLYHMFAVVMSLQSYVGEDFKLVNSFKAIIE